MNAYSFDGPNRLTQLVQQGQTGGNTVATKGAKLSYNLLGRIASIFRTDYFDVGPQPDIATSTFSYDGMNRLTGIAYTHNGGTAIDAFSWTYDAASRVTSMATTADGTANYNYDNTDQVTGASYTGTGQPANEAYSYDANGNRTNAGYSTGANNRLLSDGTFNYVYDAEGNRTSRTRISAAPANDYLTTYAWDYRNRLTDVRFYNNSNVLTKHVHYTYDVFDHRISKSLDSTGSGAYDRIEDYVYDGNNVVLDFVDPDGAGPASLALATRYLNGPGVTDAFDQVYAQEAAATGSVLWLLADNLGTTRDVVDNTGAVVGHFVYNSFGQLATGPTNLTRYLYAGQAWDADAGLQYNWHRWYDPAVGRWISEDPIGFVAGDANLSRYVGNSPTLYIDPHGLDTVKDSIRHHLATGNVEGLKDLLASGGLDQAQRAAVQAAIKKLGTTAEKIIANECKGSVLKEFPRQYLKRTLKDIHACGVLSASMQFFARRAGRRPARGRNARATAEDSIGATGRSPRRQ